MLALLIMLIVFGAFAALSARFGVDSRVDSDRSAPLRLSGRHQLSDGAAATRVAGLSAARSSSAWSRVVATA